MIPSQNFYFLRHGETDWNAQRRCQGQADIPLNDFGKWQAQSACRLIKGLVFTSLFVSPLSRAQETAKILVQQYPVPIQTVPDLAEMNLGLDEGAIHGPWLDAWRRGEYHPSKGERMQEFVSRCKRGLTKALNHPGPILIVAHGGVFWAVETLIQCQLGRSLQNGEIVFCHYSSSGWSITSLLSPDARFQIEKAEKICPLSPPRAAPASSYW